MFKFDTQAVQDTVDVVLDGQSVELPAGMTVAAALLGKGRIVSRISPTSQKPCASYCLMGVCFECMMEIDGIQRQACMTKIKAGMVINRNLKTETEVSHGESS